VKRLLQATMPAMSGAAAALVLRRELPANLVDYGVSAVAIARPDLAPAKHPAIEWLPRRAER